MNQPTVHNGGVNRGEGPLLMLLAIVTGDKLQVSVLVLVILSVPVEKFSVSRMRDFYM